MERHILPESNKFTHQKDITRLHDVHQEKCEFSNVFIATAKHQARHRWMSFKKSIFLHRQKNITKYLFFVSRVISKNVVINVASKNLLDDFHGNHLARMGKSRHEGIKKGYFSGQRSCFRIDFRTHVFFQIRITSSPGDNWDR